MRKLTRKAGRLVTRRAARLVLKRLGFTAWWIWPALWIVRRKRVLAWLDRLAHRLHLVPGGYLVPTTWLCEYLQRNDAHWDET